MTSKSESGSLSHPEPVAQEAVAWPHKASELEAAAIYLDEVDDDETESVRRVAAFLRAVAAHPAPPPEQGEDNTVPILKAMASNYKDGHRWDNLDGEAVTRAVATISTLRARVAELEARATPQAGASAEPVARWKSPADAYVWLLQFADENKCIDRDQLSKIARLLATPPDSDAVRALREVRSHFKVEYPEAREGKPSVGYDSEALPKVIAILDAALSGKGGSND